MPRRVVRRCLPALLLLGVLALPNDSRVSAAPVAADDASYEFCGRVFPDPHAYWPGEPAPTQSPWAKGNATCKAVDFLGWQETLDGLDFLATELFPDYVEVYDLSDPTGEFASVLDLGSGEGSSPGLPTEELGRDPKPMYLVRVTDEQDTAIPIDDREHFVFTLSIHGIERAGIEGGIRAVEDLATWAGCEADPDAVPTCALNGPYPHPLLETMPGESIGAGEALKQASVWFVLSNPDGWLRGDKQEGGFFYQRYNGNGMDTNRDWPTIGYTFRPYTPWSEPDTRSVGKALQAVKEKWSGGIDLHGQLIDRAFSFTLIGGSERPFDKDRRVLQFVKGAWADAEERLAWSPHIKPNDAPQQPDDPRMYGVQWGTIWDTIDYTVTGALGDWIDSPIGLGADGIDNEMSMSHLSNCGIGTCFLPDFEQLHVDGNKSLIYAMLHHRLQPTDTAFRYDGDAAYLVNPDRLSHPGSPNPTAGEEYDLPPQDDEPGITMVHGGGVQDTTHEFEVLGPAQGHYNGGMSATFTAANAGGVSPGALLDLSIDQYRPEEENPNPAGGDEDWQVVNSYFNQSPVYLQGGARVDVNFPVPGRYRLRIHGDIPETYEVDLEFHEEEAWPDPGQLPYDVSNMDFFSDLAPFVESPDKLVPVTVDDVLDGAVDLDEFDTVVAADDAFLPGYSEAPDVGDPQADIEDTVLVPGPGAGVARSEATSAYYEFTVEPGQAGLHAEVSSASVVDPDLYLQRQRSNGTWSGDLAAGETGRTGLETLSYGSPRPGTYRLEIHNWAGAPGPADLRITFTGASGAAGAATADREVSASAYTEADRDAMAAAARGFVEDGGNLVLTDSSLRALEWMGVVPDHSVWPGVVYAGYVEFSADDGETSTYDDPLAANVDQPGAAEGANHRHQVTEPVPIGYAIQDPSGGDMGSQPQWGVDRGAWEDAGGRVVGVVGSDDVTLGELEVGDGRVRILGSLVPFPTDEFDHPFGLSSYGVTYTGYEVFRNLLDWERPDEPARNPPGPDAPDPEVPSTDPPTAGPDPDPVVEMPVPVAEPPERGSGILPRTGGTLALLFPALAALAIGLIMLRRARSL